MTSQTTLDVWTLRANLSHTVNSTGKDWGMEFFFFLSLDKVYLPLIPIHDLRLSTACSTWSSLKVNTQVSQIRWEQSCSPSPLVLRRKSTLKVLQCPQPSIRQSQKHPLCGKKKILKSLYLQVQALRCEGTLCLSFNRNTYEWTQAAVGFFLWSS